MQNTHLQTLLRFVAAQMKYINDKNITVIQDKY